MNLNTTEINLFSRAKSNVILNLYFRQDDGTSGGICIVTFSSQRF